MATPAVTFSRLILALVVALVLGALVIPSVEASKPGKNTVTSISKRIADQRHNCEKLGGGKLTVKDSPFVPNQITTCEGGEYDGTRCTHTPKKTLCGVALTAHEDLGAPPAEGAILEDPAAGGTTVATPTDGQGATQGEHDRKHKRQGGKGRNK